MNTVPRTFEAITAVRHEVPLLVGIDGPSASGKTFSALRVATGIQRVVGGDIYVVDTDARRALHYADEFKFKHLDFKAPFGSLDYLAAIRHCVKEGAKCVVVDSMSHEHESEGGYLDFQANEIQRMAGDNYEKRERVKMAAWIRPAAHRRQMINGILQLNANFVFCFRAKEKIKPKPGGQPIELGFVPIAGEELIFEMTVNMLLPPKSGGVPQWRSDFVGERLMMKLPKQFEQLFADPRPLDEAHGEALAQWARGGKTESKKMMVDPKEAMIKKLDEAYARNALDPPPAKKPMTTEQWATQAIAEIAKLPTVAAINDWTAKNHKRREALADKDPHLATQIQDAINDRTDRVNVLAAG